MSNKNILAGSVADPNSDPDPPDPHVFWASWIRIHHSDVWILILIRIRIWILHQAKIVRKPLIPTVI